MTLTSLLAWTLLHFVWQGALVAGVLALMLAATRTNGAHLRYGMAAAAMVLMAILPIATALRLSLPTHGDVLATQAAAGLTGTASASAGDGERTADAQSPGPITRDVASGERTAPTPRPMLDRARNVVGNWTNASAPALVAIWLSGVLLLSLRLGGGLLRVRQLTRVGARPAPAALRARLTAIAQQLGITRVIRVVESTVVQVPAVIGWLQPVLLVPFALETGLSTDELELLLAHELAHIRRNDYLVNILQTIVETVLFYHPGVWWVSRQLRDEREHCCDDVAVSLVGDRAAYARALVHLETLRQSAPRLAAASTGGNLLLRVRRLLAAPPNAEPRARWAAIPLALAAIGGMAGAARLESRPAVRDPQAFISAESAVAQEGVQTRGASPDTVIRHPSGTGSLEERWNWATNGARADRRPGFWIGYSIKADPTQGMVYIDRHVPVVSGNSTMTGRMHFKGNSALTFSGVRLGALIGERAADEDVVLFGFTSRDGRPQLDRIHLGTGVLPVHFASRSFYWLGAAEDRESLALVHRLYSATTSREIKNDLIAVTGAHTDMSGVLASLQSWIASNEPDELRGEAAEELDRVPTREAVALLARLARGDRSRSVRRQAAEALGDNEAPEAGDTLARLAVSLEDLDVAKEAVEALGSRHEPVAFDALVRIANSNLPGDLLREAVETMGESDDARRVGELKRLARGHSRADVRQEAVETLAEVHEPTEVIPILRDIVERDAESDVRQQAVESLGELDDERAFRALVELARTHRDPEIRKKAIESLSDHGRKDEVFDLLRELLGASSDGRVGRAAIEALGDLDDRRAVELLENTATRHADASVRKAAVEALGSVAPAEQAFAALERLTGSGQSEEVQRAAVEALGEMKQPGVVAVLERIALRHERTDVRRAAVEALTNVEDDQGHAALERLASSSDDEAVQRAAIESYAQAVPATESVPVLTKLAKGGSADIARKALDVLADLDNNAGIPAVIELSRSHPDREIRRKAIDLLGDSDDPRAHAELARVLKP
jgi:HEAT repeat protein/beta-lactamase regulating signal transducer with metallopeptidase domain